MSGMKGLRSIPVLSLLLLVATGTLSTVAQAAPATGQAQSHAWKNITLLYLSDVKGKIEPCG